MKNKKHIAMRCNQEQFEAIKPKLEKAGYEFDICDFKRHDYLCIHSVNEKLITNYSKPCLNEDRRIIHEQWNEKIFLEARGIEVELKFEITKEQILEIAEWETMKDFEKVKKWFPEAFKPVLEVGKWYKTRSSLFNHQENSKSYGFMCDKWVGEWNTNPNLFNVTPIVATYEEVTEALKKEAGRRYKVGDLIKNIEGYYRETNNMLFGGESFCVDYDGSFCVKSTNDFWIRIMDKNGKWAEIIPTKTIQEAEELLKELGHEIKIV